MLVSKAFVHFGGSLTVFNSGRLPEDIQELERAAFAYTGQAASGVRQKEWPLSLYRIIIPSLPIDIHVSLSDIDRFTDLKFPSSQSPISKPNRWWRYLLSVFQANNVPVQGYPNNFL